MLDTATANNGWIESNHGGNTNFRIRCRRLATLWRDYATSLTTAGIEAP